VFAAAVDPDRAPGEREAIGQFCARHGLMPDDDIQQVLFYVLTGQLTRYRAADARGRLLGAVCQRAGHRTRTALRQVLAEAGDVELFLVLTDACPGARATILAEPESHDLICHLAGRSDWDRLWQLVRELPMGDAVTAVRYFRDGWRPSADGERVLFDRLMHTGPHQLARARDALTIPALTQVRFRDPLPVWGGAVSADGSLLALARGGPDGGTISVHTLPGSTVNDRVRHGSVRIGAPVIRSSPDKIVLAFADRALIAARVGCRADAPEALLLLYADGRRKPLADLRAALGDTWISWIAPCFTPAAGFAVLCEHQVAFCDSDGTPTGHRIALRPSPVPEMTPALLATQPGGRVAIAGIRANGVGGWAVYDAPTGGLVAGAEFGGRPTGIRFDGPSRLIVTSVLGDAGYVWVWYLDGAQAEFLASASVYGARNPVVIPGRDHIGVLAARGSRVRVFEGVTLRKARAPKGFPGQAVRRQWNSADDRILVLAGAKSATVFPGRHSVLTVADRPPTGWGPADHGIVAEALGSPDVDAAARPLLDLLQARLACRAVLPGKPPPGYGY
jgi:hypothetical protein